MLQHWLCIRRDRKTPVLLDDELLKRIDEERLPAPREQADNLIRWMGDELRQRRNPTVGLQYDANFLAALIGANDKEGVAYVLRELLKRQWIGPDLNSPIGLTFAGWDRYDELYKAHSEGPIAFMAMGFHNSDVLWVYENCFSVAAAAAGFELRKLDERQSAGLIDVRLRVEIRKCRFLLCDLTDENRGAYWEAGFAEGLGKPVIYTCEKDFFEKKGTHFDTNHHLTLKWSKDAYEDAIKVLRDTIRETLPREAKMGD
jgi:hypothetical protein